jgi:hypothetical protein
MRFIMGMTEYDTNDMELLFNHYEEDNTVYTLFKPLLLIKNIYRNDEDKYFMIITHHLKKDIFEVDRSYTICACRQAGMQLAQLQELFPINERRRF